jgi:hypothetical protein
MSGGTFESAVVSCAAHDYLNLPVSPFESAHIKVAVNVDATPDRQYDCQAADRFALHLRIAVSQLHY